MKSSIIRLLGSKYHHNLVTFRAYLSDYARFSRAALSRCKSNYIVSLETRITMKYHALEKSLVLPHFEPGHGGEHRLQLMNLLVESLPVTGRTRLWENAFNVLRRHYDEDKHAGFIDKSIEAFLNTNKPSNQNESLPLPVYSLERDLLEQWTFHSMKHFFETRKSIRDFTQADVSVDVLENAASIAITAPSVCNRQSASVIIIKNSTLIKKVLSLQNGNRGFTNSISCLAVIVSDLRRFVNFTERNQAFVDGGLFSLAFILGLHSQQVGSCCLNWCVDRKSDKKLKLILGIEDSSIVIMLVAIGHLKQVTRVTGSMRRETSEILEVIQ